MTPRRSRNNLIFSSDRECEEWLKDGWVMWKAYGASSSKPLYAVVVWRKPQHVGPGA